MKATGYRGIGYLCMVTENTDDRKHDPGSRKLEVSSSSRTVGYVNRSLNSYYSSIADNSFEYTDGRH